MNVDEYRKQIREGIQALCFEKMDRFIQLKSKKTLVSAAFALLAVLLCFFSGGSLKAGLVFAVMLLACGCFRLEEGIIKDAGLRAGYVLWLLLCGCITLFLSQLIQNESVFDLPLRQIALGWICCLVPVLLLYALTLRPRLSGLLASALLLALSTVNQYVYAFRGSELCPADILTVGTAINVADKYTYTLPGQVLYAWLLFVCYCLFSMGLPAAQQRRRSAPRLSALAAACVMCAAFYVSSPKITVQHFLHGGSYWNGFLLNFTLEIPESIVRKPVGYSPARVRELSNKYPLQGDNGKTPDIIVIMNEAYSDLGVLGEGLNTSVPVSPFIASLRENTTHGYALSSVYGGGTPNSEYEFLSGNSMLFLNGIVYQQYLREPSFSMVSLLKELGYRTIAMHPYLSDGWKRNKVWPNLLFDECLFLESFPQQDLVRGLVSDREMYGVLLDTYEEYVTASEEPVFIFGVTMQNHSSYDYAGDDFENSVELVGYSREYPDAEQYLSLIHETDRAAEHLLDRLKDTERDVVVVFYGDHQPALNKDFLEEVHGGAFETLDDNQLLQLIPFFIWTNYDSREESIPLTSLNYLSTYVYEKAGIELPAYNRFLSELEQVVPAMNSHGYYSVQDACFRTRREADGAEKEWLDAYWLAEYNALFDLKNLDEIFFPGIKQREHGE